MSPLSQRLAVSGIKCRRTQKNQTTETWGMDMQMLFQTATELKTAALVLMSEYGFDALGHVDQAIAEKTTDGDATGVQMWKLMKSTLEDLMLGRLELEGEPTVH